jgi:hypothetical protein
MASPVEFLIFERMTHIEESSAGNSDDRSLIERHLLSRASVKRESRQRPTKNRVASLASLRFCRNFNNHDPWSVPSRILKLKV